MKIDPDAFSSGQIGSKLWLCEHLENTKWISDITHIYGGWQGLLGFLLLTRNTFKVNKIQSYDIDATCQPIADTINENYVWQNWKFKSYTANCDYIDPSSADLTINTSTEHFKTDLWFERLPKGRRVVLQGNNMNHNDHQSNIATLNDFKARYPLREMIYCNQMQFEYPTWGFTRFMLIGIK
jgi:hypothetical protein